MSLLLATICWIACHGGAADHFATFVECHDKDLKPFEIYASGAALKKFQERNIEIKYQFTVDNISAEEEDILAEQIAKKCVFNSVVITDLGHIPIVNEEFF